ncbi:MAG TPA: hypothetical protein VF171_02040, partial [Trueperaceae bacterium]
MTPGAPTDPFARRVYLQALPAPLPSTRYSHGARRRAAELQRFVRGLQRTAGRELALRGSLELVVVDAGDWRKLFGRTYGPAFARARPAGASVIAAADYPPRLLRRFDEVFLRAAQAGERAPLEAGACLDLWVGH